MSDIGQIEQRLDQARLRRRTAVKALAPKHKGGEWAEFNAAHQEVLGLERELAAVKHEQFAEPLPFPVKWDVGAPLPHLIVNDSTALLSFYLSEPDPHWDGTYVTIKDPKSGLAESLALVEFDYCLSAKLGSPNDEVFEGHPLEGHGLEAYGAQLVRNSNWLRELQQINSVHHMYRASSWDDLKHYLFWFHDSTFECIARSFNVEIFQESMAEMLSRMVRRILEH
jgi:hypothetical protein